MQVRLHKNATTTPKIRSQLREESKTKAVRQLAEEYNVSVDTVMKWKHRTTDEDCSSTPHRLQTTLSAEQEEMVVVLRTMLWLSLDDLLSVVHEFLDPHMLRSSLHRLLKRRGISRKPVDKEKPSHKPFKVYDPGYVHIDIKYLPMMPGDTKKRYLFVVIDRATRWVFVEVYGSKSAKNARRFLSNLHKKVSFYIKKILTDNGKEFTDRFVTTGERTPTGNHEFDKLCHELGIEHRLTKPYSPQTNGMVERFNGRIADILRTNRFRDGEDLEETIKLSCPQRLHGFYGINQSVAMTIFFKVLDLF